MASPHLASQVAPGPPLTDPSPAANGDGSTACSVILNGRRCRAARTRGTDVCYTHRHHRLAGVSVSLLELARLAETFDQRSRSAGELYPAADFVSWVAPELQR